MRCVVAARRAAAPASPRARPQQASERDPARGHHAAAEGRHGARCARWCAGCVLSRRPSSRPQDKKRGFTETIELQIGLKNYDPQKDKRFSGSIRLPYVPRPKLKASHRHLLEAAATAAVAEPRRSLAPAARADAA